MAMGDVDADNVLDLVVGAGKDHASEVVVYSGKGEKGKTPFTTELARSMAFAPDARGGASAWPWPRSTARSPTISSWAPAQASWTKCESCAVGNRGAAPDLFASFKPYDNDHSG